MEEKIRVLVTLPFEVNLIERLQAVSPRLEIIQQVARTSEDILDHINGVEILYAWQSLPQPDEAPALRWVQLHFAGADTILNHPLYLESDVRFTTTSGIHAVSVAEYVFMQVLAFAHHLPQMMEDKAEGKWPKGRWERYLPTELRSATLGIIGYGAIGREVARLGKAFGMEVLALKRNLRRIEHAGYDLPGTIGDSAGDLADRLYPPGALYSMLAECDYVVVTLPFTEQTYHFIDADAFAAMKRTAVFINVGRGKVVDEVALTHVLEHGLIAGAGLDVFEEEPLPQDSPLWTIPNVILSPHVSGYSAHYDARAVDVFAENLYRYLVGEKLLNLVDRKQGY